MNNKHLHVHLRVGPGGRRCACCFPAPGSMERRKRFRVAKRKQAREHWMLELATLN